MNRRLSTVAACLLLLLGVAAVNAAGKPEPTPAVKSNIDFGRDIYPVLRRSCFECHGENRQEADLRLDRRGDVLESGLVAAGNPDDSELLRRITLPQGDAEIMPAIGDPLPPREVEAIRRWIQQGAIWPEDFEERTHWAYLPPKRPPLPLSQSAHSAWPKSPIDHFVLDRLQQEGLAPSPPASPETLVRRLYLDLIGLPPSPAEVDAFLAAPPDTRVERLVDNLLGRPQFGERWARPWLDLARYADSHGFQRDNFRDIWAYRDWVIRALNDDMPFDRFTIEQIAGDLLPGATESQKIATGFHRCTPTNVEAGSLPEETRIEQVIDRVNTTGAVWLGTTLECAQCHDHKYDPISMKEYYRLLAFFNSTQLEADRASQAPSSIQFLGPSMPLSDPVRDSKREQLNQQLAQVKHRLNARHKQLAGGLAEWASTFVTNLGDVPQTHTLEVVSFQSLGSTDTFERLEDGSLLLVGADPPNTDIYSVRVKGNLKAVRAFRLDVLTHETLPGSGPGRGDSTRNNFVLNEFSAQCVPLEAGQEQGGKQLQFASAAADFSQKNWDVSGAVDGQLKTGWAIAPEFSKSHWANFVLSEPLDMDERSPVEFQLEQKFGSARTIGRFKLSAITGNLDLQSVPAKVIEAAKKSPETWSEDDRKTLLDYCQDHDSEAARLTRQVARLEKQKEQVAADTTLVMIELEEPRPAHMFERGDYKSPGEPVTPGVPGILHEMPSGPANRLTLARWLVDPANPLVARVTVNRWWAELFGRGIVATPEDFGLKGEPPTHPELLDWLAVEFMENGWSMKQLLRTIVLSATYQQSSRLTPELLAKDDQNRLLARGPRFRMDAEMIRDNALAVSGLLSLQQFGPAIRPYQPDGIWRKVGGANYEYVVSPGDEKYRRGLYVVLKRGAPYPSFINFDASARLACTVKRSRTNTPLQALTLLNDPVYVEAAKALAYRVLSESPTQSLEGQLEYAVRLCTARMPDEAEKEALRELYEQQLAAAKEAPDSAKKLVEKRFAVDGVTPAQFTAWYSVATTLLNLHETITKE